MYLNGGSRILHFKSLKICRLQCHVLGIQDVSRYFNNIWWTQSLSELIQIIRNMELTYLCLKVSIYAMISTIYNIFRYNFDIKGEMWNGI